GEQLHDRPQQRRGGERGADPDAGNAADRGLRAVEDPGNRQVALHHGDDHRCEREPVASRADERSLLRMIKLLQPHPRERDQDERGREGKESHVGERNGQRARTAPRRPHAMHVARREPEKQRLDDGHRERERRDVLADRIADAEQDQHLPGHADRETELPGEVVLGDLAEQRPGDRTRDDPDDQRGGGILDDEAHAHADEEQEEQRAEPSRDAEHHAHEPRRAHAVPLRHFALHQPGLPQPTPGLCCAHFASSAATDFSHQPPAAEMPITSNPTTRNAPASTRKKWRMTTVLTTTTTESTPPASTNRSFTRCRYRRYAAAIHAPHAARPPLACRLTMSVTASAVAKPPLATATTRVLQRSRSHSMPESARLSHTKSATVFSPKRSHSWRSLPENTHSVLRIVPTYSEAARLASSSQKSHSDGKRATS